MEAVLGIDSSDMNALSAHHEMNEALQLSVSFDVRLSNFEPSSVD